MTPRRITSCPAAAGACWALTTDSGRKPVEEAGESLVVDSVNASEGLPITDP